MLNNNIGYAHLQLIGVDEKKNLVDYLEQSLTQVHSCCACTLGLTQEKHTTCVPSANFKFVWILQCQGMQTDSASPPSKSSTLVRSVVRCRTALIYQKCCLIAEACLVLPATQSDVRDTFYYQPFHQDPRLEPIPIYTCVRASAIQRPGLLHSTSSC